MTFNAAELKRKIVGAVAGLGGLESIFQDIDAILATISALEAQLAECYRLSGADPDGNEDWRLASHAVEEVRRMRSEYDEACEQISALEKRVEELEAEKPDWWSAEWNQRQKDEINRLQSENDDLRQEVEQANEWIRELEQNKPLSGFYCETCGRGINNTYLVCEYCASGGKP